MKLRTLLLTACLMGGHMLPLRAEPSPWKTPAPTENRYSLEYNWGSAWGGALDAIVGGTIFLDASSSQPKGFLSRIYDGNRGSLADPTGTFLIFDGPRAAFRIVVPEWREVRSIALDALEATRRSRGSVHLFFTRGGFARQEIVLSRRIVERRNGLAHARYVGLASSGGWTDGEFLLTYENPDFASAFLSEITLDGLGTEATPGEPPDPLLVFWQRFRTADAKPLVLDSMMIRTDSTGDKAIDLTPAWLVSPAGRGTGALPLVVAVNETDSGRSGLEILGLEGAPELGLAPVLAEAGIAVLVVDLPASRRRRYDPRMLARKVLASLAQVLSGQFLRRSGVTIDPARIAIWGNEDGAIPALIATLEEPRFQSVALSGVPNRYCPGVPRPPACHDEGDTMKLLRERLQASIGSRHALVIGGPETIAHWQGVARASPNIELGGSAYHSFGKDERAAIVGFLSRRLGAEVSDPESHASRSLPKDAAGLDRILERRRASEAELRRAMGAR
jgi:hypothetical protein